MSKKYDRSGMEKESESEYLELREKGHSADEAYEILEDKKAMHRIMTRMFGHNGWNL